jgi:hypothetical protein
MPDLKNQRKLTYHPQQSLITQKDNSAEATSRQDTMPPLKPFWQDLGSHMGQARGDSSWVTLGSRQQKPLHK